MKLELTGNQNDDLTDYLDEILTGLKYGEGKYELVSLDDEIYQERLDELMAYWDALKEKDRQVRESGYAEKEKEELLRMSEEYFKMADETVSAAEIYSQKIANIIRILEIVTTGVMFFLLCLVLKQMVEIVRMSRCNTMLQQKVYTDMHTGLQNKNMCEELLGDDRVITTPTACIMFDMNNLKETNDRLGHLAGDKLIADFAKALKSSVRETDFVGRCGGDEFMMVLYAVEESIVKDVLDRLQGEVDSYNSLGTAIQISYASGWALSTEYKDCTLRLLFQMADRRMYTNKQRMKKKIAR